MTKDILLEELIRFLDDFSATQQKIVAVNVHGKEQNMEYKAKNGQ